MKRKLCVVFLILILAGLLVLLTVLLNRLMSTEKMPAPEEYLNGELNFFGDFTECGTDRVTVCVEANLESGEIACMADGREVDMELTLIAPDGTEYTPDPVFSVTEKQYRVTSYREVQSFSCTRSFSPGSASDGAQNGFAPGFYSLRVSWFGKTKTFSESVIVLSHAFSEEEKDGIKGIASLLCCMDDENETDGQLTGLYLLLYEMEDELPFPCEYEDEEYNCVRAKKEDVNDFFMATLGVPFREPAEEEEENYIAFCRNGNVYVEYSDANIWAKILRAEEAGDGKISVTAEVVSAYDDSVVDAVLLFDVSPVEGYLGFKAEPRACIGNCIINPEKEPGTFNQHGRRYVKDLRSLLDELDLLDAASEQ